MSTALTVDLVALARELELPVEQVERTLQLLDDGNTIPFITRYRKDRTGGLNEEQIEQIQQGALKLRLLAERKQSILRSLASQDKLTPELEAKINSARTLKWLEDVYLPFKPKKQTLATIARQRGLEPLAREILDADPAAQDLSARAATFVSAEQGLASVDEVLQGVGYILAEWFSERVDLRARLRKALRREGVLTCTRVEPAERAETQATQRMPNGPAASQQPAASPVSPAADHPEAAADGMAAGAAPQGGATATAEPARPEDAAGSKAPPSLSEPDVPSGATQPGYATPASAGESFTVAPPAVDVERDVAATHVASHSAAVAEPPAGSAAEEHPAEVAASANAATERVPAGASPTVPASPPAEKETHAAASAPLQARAAAVKAKAMRKQLAKERKKKLLEHAFKDYYNFHESLSRLPPHRILAINRGERAKVLRVRIDYNAESLIEDAIHQLVPSGHVHAEFLTACGRDSLQRLVLPSLERELRRELGEEAEQHAVQVFVRNLRKLLLQPPVHNKRVLAVDPGFRSGCKLAAVDAFGKLLELGSISLIGGEEQRAQARAKLADFIRRNQIELVAIGNGAGCRAAEQLVSDVINSDLTEMSVAYVIVNEAGASFYSTSQVGRDELPQCDPMMRSAVSIARRLQDPLSELVKINPANIGVGMYQHDMKLKHLRDSLDKVVNSCVNFVGVELNSASPSLLAYVSGLNQLTARRIYEYRQQHGPFRNREQIKSVPGIGEATFIQAAGFLRISEGDNPLDATWIHPESYGVAQRVLERLEIPLPELAGSGKRESVSRAAEFAGEPSAIADRTAPTPDATEPAPTPASAGDESGAASEVDETGVSAAAELPTAQEEVPPASPAAESTAESTAEESLSPSHPADISASAEPAAPDAVTPESASQEAAQLSAAEGTTTLASPAAEAVASSAEAASSGPSPRSLAQRLTTVDVSAMARELSIGELSLRDILAALAKPGRDPRDDFSPPPFRTGIMKLEDLKPGMVLQGTVLNVVDFGAFVDIGISDSALIHISKLADQFIRDPQEVVSVGDILKVWVIAVDKERRRVSLSAVDPAQARPPRPQREGRGRRSRPPKAGAAPAPPGGARQNAPGTQAARPPKRTPAAPAKRPPKVAGRGKPPAKPKPVRPITSAMLTGKQPMRSFSDLMQFYEKKQQDGDPPK